MVDRLSDDQLRSIKDAVTVLIDAEFASIPEVQRVASSLRDLLNQVDVYLTSPSQEADEEVKHDKAREQCTFYFIDADKLRAEGDTFDRMPEFGTLQQMGGWLVQKAIEIPKAHTGVYVDDMLAVSHSWESKSHPDTIGEQWKNIRKFMNTERGSTFKWVWVDFPCMPQGSRTPYQRTVFRWMLKNVNALFLGGSILIVMDSAYLSTSFGRSSRPGWGCNAARCRG